jgi:hypothetical protein
MRANVPPRASRAPSLSDRNYMAAPTAGVSDANRFPGKSAGRTERALLWGFTAGLAWCPFWFGGSVLLAWGINAVLFPGLVVIYELSLLIRRQLASVHADAARQDFQQGVIKKAAVQRQSARWLRLISPALVGTCSGGSHRTNRVRFSAPATSLLRLGSPTKAVVVMCRRVGIWPILPRRDLIRLAGAA